MLFRSGLGRTRLNNPRLAAMNWRVAVASAGANPEQLTWLAQFAEKHGEADTAKRAWRSLIACSRNPRYAFQELERLTRKSGSTLELRQVMAELASRWPKEPALQNEVAYLNLLLGDDPEPERKKAESLVREFPTSLSYRTTLALALWRLRDFADALGVYAGRTDDWSQAPAGQRAVYAAVLAGNGRTAEAREIARALAADQLRQEELELIQPLL